MKKNIILIGLILLESLLFSISLKEVYDAASATEGYDKYLELETGVIYTGGLYVGKVFNRMTNEYEGDVGGNVMIKGNGAILNLQGEQITFSYTDQQLDIEDCIILNGNIRYRGVNSSTFNMSPVGSVRNVTFYKPHDYAVRLQGAGEGVILENNISVDVITTGDDYVAISGFPLEWLPTGISFAFDIALELYGIPEVYGNFSYFSDESTNADSLWHFTFL